MSDRAGRRVARGDHAGVDVYLAVCAIFRDEAAYLPEWIEFHREVAGVERFILFDNLSSDRPREVLAPWIADGSVTVADCHVPFASGAQHEAYERGVRWAAGRVRWIGFIDVDEFLFSPGGVTVADVLGDYEGHPGVVVNWHVYGSAGLQHRPQGLVTESFLRRAPTRWVRNRRVKSLVDPRRVVAPVGPHFFTFAEGERAVTENHEPVEIAEIGAGRRWINRRLARSGASFVDPFPIREIVGQPLSVGRLRINHYAVKSSEEFADKIARHRDSDPKHLSGSRIPSLYWRYHDRNEVFDPVLAPHAPRIQQRVRAMIEAVRERDEPSGKTGRDDPDAEPCVDA